MVNNENAMIFVSKYGNARRWLVIEGS